MGRRTAAPLTVSVLIPAHNEAETIWRTVRSVMEQTYRPSVVFVIDDSSTDETAELARRAGATVVSAKCGGKAKALNLALQYVTTDVVIGVDADTILAPDAIEHLVADLAKGYDGTCATVLPQQKRGFIVRARWFQYALARRWWKAVQREIGRIYVLAGCSYSIRTEALRAIGGYVEADISEDGHTTWRLYEAGFRITYTARAVAYSQEPETWRVWYRQQRRWASGFFQIIGAYKRELTKPKAALVIGSMLFDLAMMPITYLTTAYIALTGVVNWRWIISWLVAYNLATITIASLEMGARQALLSFIPHKVVAMATSWMYVACGIREWMFGRHYTSWTGRQNRPVSITPMPVERRYVFASLACLGGLWAAFTSFGTELAAASALAAIGIAGFLLVRGPDAPA